MAAPMQTRLHALAVRLTSLVVLVSPGLALVPQDPPPPQPAPATDPVGFRKLDLAAALKAAEAEKKVVLLAFVDRESDDGRKMASETWGDAVMLRWLEARVVGLELEFKRDAALAERYGVTGSAATLVCTPAGEEIERWEGVVAARELMPKMQPYLKGGEALAAARRAWREDPASARARMKLGEAYAGMRILPKAAECYLQAWDEGAGQAEFAEERRNELVSRLCELASRDQGLKREVARRRDVVRDRLLRFAEGDDPLALALDLAALNTGLLQPAKQYDVLLALRAREGTPPAVLAASFSDNVAFFLQREGRWKELLEARGDALAHFDATYGKWRADYDKALAREDLPPSGLPAADPLIVRRSALLAQAGVFVEALVRTEQAKAAFELAELVANFDPRPTTYLVLSGALERGGDAERKELFLVQGRKLLSEKERAELELLLQRAAGRGR